LLEALRDTLANPKVSPDDVEKSERFIALQREHAKALKAAQKEFEEKIAARDKEAAREKTWSKAKEVILAEVTKKNPVLPADAAKREAWLNLFLQNEFAGLEFEDVNGELVPMKNGAPVKDAHLNARSLAELAIERADRFFDYETQQAVGNAGNTNDGTGAGSSNSKVGKFKDENDLSDNTTRPATPTRNSRFPRLGKPKKPGRTKRSSLNLKKPLKLWPLP
jgi:hypothetical protein